MLRFNASKCKVMHLGYANQQRDFQMGSADQRIVLETTTCEKDLGVHIDPSLHFSQHCRKVTSKANKILGLIRRSFDHMDGPMLTQLFKGLVRPHLEYANASWSPQYNKDANLLESIQHRATKMVPELRDLEYEDRLKALRLPSLTYRRRRGDLIETYKYCHKIYNVDSKKLIPPSTFEKTRGHEHKLATQSHRLGIRGKFFSLRIREAWNALPESVAQAPSINCFKGRLDKFLWRQHFSTEFPLPVIRAAGEVEIERDPSLQSSEGG